MLSIAVCDDNIFDCCNIAANIKNILEEIKTPFIIRQFNSGKKLLQALEDFDIIFLDIIMNDVDGMETAQLLRNKAFDKILIFISSSRNYVFEAYDVEAFQYLLKPVDIGKLKSVITRALAKLEQNAKDFIIINKERQKQKILLQNIYFFEIKGRIIYVHGTEGMFYYYEQISVLEKTLQGKGFFRCHKSFLINLQYVNTYNSHEVILDNGERIPIAKRRYDAFCKEILEFMKKTGGSI